MVLRPFIMLGSSVERFGDAKNIKEPQSKYFLHLSSPVTFPLLSTFSPPFLSYKNCCGVAPEG
jgi:hypothetical protein